jgi:hypothetical protein
VLARVQMTYSRLVATCPFRSWCFSFLPWIFIEVVQRFIGVIKSRGIASPVTPRLSCRYVMNHFAVYPLHRCSTSGTGR